MENVSNVASTFFDGIWDILIHTDFPGLGVSLAAVLIGVLIIRFSVTVFQFVTGFGASGSDYGKAADGLERLKSKKLKGE